MTLKPEHIVEELNRTPKLKRDLIMKMMEVMQTRRGAIASMERGRKAVAMRRSTTTR